MDSNGREDPETIGEAAARLLGRLIASSKKNAPGGVRPEQILGEGGNLQKLQFTPANDFPANVNELPERAGGARENTAPPAITAAGGYEPRPGKGEL